MVRRILSILVCIVVVCTGCEDDDPAPGDSAAAKAMINVSAVDAMIASMPAAAQATMDALVAYVSDNTANAPERAYAIYRWIRDNIQADFETAELDYIDPATQTADAVFASRKAVCTGYSNVFETLAEKAGFEATVIYGYGVMFYADPDVPRDDYLHIWNGINIDGKWYLVELSWIPSLELDGSGDPNYFFLTDPAGFAYRHLPTSEKWQLLNPPVSSDEFWARLTQ